MLVFHIDIICDAPNCPHFPVLHGTANRKFVRVFGRSWPQCEATARAQGWFVASVLNFSLCPHCTAAATACARRRRAVWLHLATLASITAHHAASRQVTPLHHF